MALNPTCRFLLKILFVLLFNILSKECFSLCVSCCADEAQSGTSKVIDDKSIEELESQQFEDLTEESVQKECEDWVAKSPCQVSGSFYPSSTLTGFCTQTSMPLLTQSIICSAWQ